MSLNFNCPTDATAILPQPLIEFKLGGAEIDKGAGHLLEIRNLDESTSKTLKMSKHSHFVIYLTIFSKTLMMNYIMRIFNSDSFNSIRFNRVGHFFYLLSVAIVFSALTSCHHAKPRNAHPDKEKVGEFWVVYHPTKNIGRGTNEVKGIVLHHTATASIENSLRCLAPEKNKTSVSCHALIDTDGTRYILAEPEAITWHAGHSRLNGRNGCNRFTIGIELQGNTRKQPLTDAQLRSLISYMMPIIKKYNIPLENIVTHEQVRDNWLKVNKSSKVAAKVDITREEYNRVMTALRDSLKHK